MNDEFCADEEEGSEFREVRENRMSFEKLEREQSEFQEVRENYES